ncbi:hypothetical protein JZX87_09935 [Agrobacterium sp. Ap1]|uniref:hypothetical protein n=1 Tax=Agrobacterium sp. Ap1 TaxID=2815337 RepID=UPI001A9070CD|nr:hypothetical protein [Agrobacterium sp. Ap1]MBO0141482.1 hypothetical protein [Agrobacterium sp. Ap1]
MNALKLFRSGMDYISIASHLNTTEAEVERQIHRLRRIERIQPYLSKRAKREAKREAQRVAAQREAERLAARSIASVPKPPRVKQTPEQKKALKQAYNKRMRAQLAEIREAHRV